MDKFKTGRMPAGAISKFLRFYVPGSVDFYVRNSINAGTRDLPVFLLLCTVSCRILRGAIEAAPAGLLAALKGLSEVFE